MSVLLCAAMITTAFPATAYASPGEKKEEAAVAVAVTDAQAPQNGLIADYSFVEQPEDGKNVENQAKGEGAVGDAVIQNDGTARWEDSALVFNGEGDSGTPTGTWVLLPQNILKGKASATVSMEVKVDPETFANDHFVWNIGNEGTLTDWFISLKTERGHRTAIKYDGSEKIASAGNVVEPDHWYQLTSVVDAQAHTLTFYIDGKKVAEKQDAKLSLEMVSDQSRNTIGRSPYAADRLFKGAVSTFRVYDRALSGDEVMDLSDADGGIHADYFKENAGKVLEGIGDFTIMSNIYGLPGCGGAVTWTSDMKEVTIAEDGVTAMVTQPAEGGEAVTGTLTANAGLRGQIASRKVNVTILPAGTVDLQEGLIADYSFVERPEDGKTVKNRAEESTVGDAAVQNPDTAVWEHSGLTLSGEGTTNVATGTWVLLPGDILKGKTSATISLEVKADAEILPKDHFVWSIGSNTGTMPYWFAHMGVPRTTLGNGSGRAGEITATGSRKLEADRWYQMTSVLDAGSHSCTFYIDGQKVGEVQNKLLSLEKVNDQSRNTIGLSPFDADPLFKGAVSTFRVYDRALSETEIKKLSDTDGPLHTDQINKFINEVGDVVISDTSHKLWDYNGTVTWKSDMKEITIAGDGLSASVKQPETGAAAVTGNLTAVVSYRGATMEKKVGVTVLPEAAPDDPYGYLMVHFLNESPDGYPERVYLSVSQGDDPRDWLPLNGGEAVLASDRSMTGSRDPFITYSPETETYYIISTDLRWVNGPVPGGLHGALQYETGKINVWESKDLIHWSGGHQLDPSLDGYQPGSDGQGVGAGSNLGG